MNRPSILVALILCIAISACSAPTSSALSESQVQTQVAQTLAALPTPTPLPTYTPFPTFTPPPSATPTPTFAKWTVQVVADKIVAAGLEFANPTPMSKDDYGLAPMSAKEAIHFFLPSLCSDCGGRLMVFESQADLALVQAYYVELGKQSAAYFSWVLIKDNILIQLNGDYPEAKAQQYQDLLNNLQ